MFTKEDKFSEKHKRSVFSSLPSYEKLNEIHLDECDLALEKCPNSCGVSVQRRYKSLHLKNECLLRPPSLQRPATATLLLAKLRSALDEERRLRGVAVAEFRQRCDALDQWNKKLVQVLAAFKLFKYVEAAKAALGALGEQLEAERAQRLRSEGEYDEQLARLSGAVATARDLHSALEERYTELVSSCERLTLEVEELARSQLLEGDAWRAEVRGERRLGAERADALRQELQALKKRMEEENVALSGVWGDQEARLERLENRVASLASRVADMDQQLVQQQDLRHAVQVPGRLLWKITDFDQKMADAKEHDTVLHSPIFFSQQFGHKLRLEVHLNGVGHWKGRNMIVGLQVLPGDWDALLPQPFNRKVSVTLRDQAPSSEQANNLMKILKAGTTKEDPAGYHQFFPHKTMQQFSYIKDNAIYLEVTVE
ncbi:TNF receptor-associated factor 3 [Schistocerca serialis cubense]|uniref:TNF receptor-associated factor 3 n=1 Tax=Schistocerca serialis cubense TaxID=2023355 RepID=UPI00214F01F6|nr:TNF receptor-associated factor 3 [Schistocerca serialis cubense]